MRSFAIEEPGSPVPALYATLPPALANGQSNGDYPLFCRFLQWCRKLLLVTQAPSKYGYILIFSSPQGEARENTWVGTFHCDPGYTLASRYDVCNSLVKQRSIGKNIQNVKLA